MRADATRPQRFGALQDAVLAFHGMQVCPLDMSYPQLTKLIDLAIDLGEDGKTYVTRRLYESVSPYLLRQIQLRLSNQSTDTSV